MAPPVPSQPDSVPVCVPYAQATPAQLSRALVYAVQALSAHFPTLDFRTWAGCLPHLQPDLWVSEGDAVHLDDDALGHLTQHLAASPALADLDSPACPPRADYLAKRLVNYQDEALEALADIEANPPAYGSRVFALVTGLALGNSVAEGVFRPMWGTWGRPGSPDLAPARSSAHEQVRALRHARGEVGYSVLF